MQKHMRVEDQLHGDKFFVRLMDKNNGQMAMYMTPLMVAIEAAHAGVKVFSLPSVDHPVYGRHIELGVKGAPSAVALAYPALLAGLGQFNLTLGPELVR